MSAKIADLMIALRSLRSSLMKWRLATVIVALIFVISSMGFSFSGEHHRGVGVVKATDFVARAVIEGMIVEDRDKIKGIEDLIENDRCKALLVEINSPGGTVVGSEMLFKVLRKVADKKPVVAVMGSVAASGGYMTAIAADYVVAHEGTITGSIGVLMKTFDTVGLLDKIGMKPTVLRSGKMKGVPSGVEALSNEETSILYESVDDAYDFFVGLVSVRRSLDIDVAKTLSDGRIYTGRQALKHKLVDSVGGVDDAMKWLHENKSIDPKLKLVDMSKMLSTGDVVREFLKPKNVRKKVSALLGGGQSSGPEMMALTSIVQE